ncbi:MAG: enoyl-CoA hydratase-related protein [Bdellovibrionota bacterium]
MGELFYSGRHIRVESFPNGVKKLIFSRPDIRNAFHAEMISEITTALNNLTTISDILNMRLLILEGEGKVFSAGADLNYMKEQSKNTQEQNLQDARHLGNMFFQLASFPTPVVCAVKGAAIGGGLGLTTCADFVLCEENTIFCTSEVLLGLIPAVISPYIIRKVGLAQASFFMLSGSKMNAQDAFNFKLANRITTESNFNTELDNVAKQFLCAGPYAARKTKELILNCAPLPQPALFEYCAAQIAAVRSGEEAQQGLNSFFSKKEVSW